MNNVLCDICGQEVGNMGLRYEYVTNGIVSYAAPSRLDFHQDCLDRAIEATRPKGVVDVTEKFK